MMVTSRRLISEQMIQFLPFQIRLNGSDFRLALNIQKVKEVVEYANLSPIPHPDNTVIGIFNLRGAPVPVLNLESLFKEHPEISEPCGTPTRVDATAGSPRLLICELQGVWVGIPVCRTERILTCPNQDFLPPPSTTTSTEIKLFTGLLRVGGDFIPVLDLDHILVLLGHDSSKEDGASLDRAAAIKTYPGKRVLIVEDSKVILKKLVLLFTAMGCETFTATDGQQALDILDKQGNRIDLIFTDIEMPILDGITMVRQLKSNLAARNIPVLFNSALSNPALIRDIESESLGRYLVKFDEPLIRNHVEAIFGDASAAA